VFRDIVLNLVSIDLATSFLLLHYIQMNTGHVDNLFHDIKTHTLGIWHIGS